MRMGMLSALQDRGGAAQDARPPHAQQQQQHHARRRPHEPRHYESRLARGGSHGELRTMAPLDRAVVEMVRPLPRSPPPPSWRSVSCCQVSRPGLLVLHPLRRGTDIL